MDKKFLIFIIVAAVVIFGIFGVWLWTRTLPEIEESIVFPEPEIEKEVKLEISVGYSALSKDVSRDIKEEIAVNEAFNEMMKGLEKEPSFVVLTSTVGFDQEKVLLKARELLPENCKIYGYTSLLGLMTQEGFVMGEEVEEGNVLGMMGFRGENLVVGVGGASLDEKESPEELAMLALERALADREKDVKPSIIMMASSPFGAFGAGEHLFVKGVEGIVGKDTPIVGGGAAGGYSDLVSGGEALFANNEVYEKGVVIAALYTDTRIGHAFLGGFSPAGPSGKVTEIVRDEKGVRLISIDNQPAAEVYNEWMGGKLEEFLGTSDSILGISLGSTFGIKVLEDDGTENWHMIVAFNFNPDDSITLGTIIPEGAEVYLLETNLEAIIERPSLTIRLARGRGGIPEEDIAGVLLDQCIGGLLLIPDSQEWNTMIEKAQEASGYAPFMGISNLGPYGHFVGIGSRYGEVTPSVLVFGKY